MNNKYIWLFDPQTDDLYRYDYETEDDYQEPGFDTVTSYINLYKKVKNMLKILQLL